MRRRRKNREMRRLAVTGVLFLITLGILIAVTLIPEKKPENSDSSATSTQSDALIETSDTDADPQRIAALATAAFSEKTFAAKYMAVYDVTADLPLYEKNTQERITAASTVKLLTALTMLDHVTEDEIFTVGSEITLIGSGSSTAKLKQGYVLTTEQILDALLIPSGNDAAHVIAAHVGRKLAKDPQISDREAVDRFLDQMNNKARAIGATDSSFTSPDGYPNKTQYTTAADMLKISVAASRNATVRRTVEKVYVAHEMNDGTVLEYTNTNKLIVPSSSQFYEGLFGLKTGTTNASGCCLVAGCNVYGHEIVIVIFNAPDDASRWADCRVAIDCATDAVTAAQKEYAEANGKEAK